MSALPVAPLPESTLRFTVDAQGRYTFVCFPRRVPGAWMTLFCREGVHDACPWVLRAGDSAGLLSPPCGCACGHNAAWVMPKRTYEFTRWAVTFENPAVEADAAVAEVAADTATMRLF